MNEPMLFLGPNAPAADEAAGWVEREFGNVELGDTRRNQRLLTGLQTLITHPGQSIPQMMNSWSETKAFYRLLDQPALSAELIFQAHCEGTLGRVLEQSEAAVLAIQDTTTLNFTTRTALEHKGPIGSDKGSGLNLHNTLLVGAESDHVYGLLGSKIFVRDPKTKAQQGAAKKAQNRQPLEQKESVRWRESYQLAHDCHRRLRAQGASDLITVSVGDREADIYEVMLEAQRHCDEGMHLLVRATHPRRIRNPQSDQQSQLWGHITSLPAAGTFTVSVPKRSGMQTQEVELEVRFDKRELEVPRDRAKYCKATEPLTEITAIEVREPGNEEGIHWKLLTTLAVNSAEDAARVVRWYSKRWKIEVMHRVLKSGCKVEQRQLQSAERLEPMIAMDLVTACYLMGLCAAARQSPEAPATSWIAIEEAEALQGYFKLRDQAPSQITLAEVVRLIAQLGGHLGRKGDGPPGAEVLWRGLIKLQVIAETWQILKKDN